MEEFIFGNVAIDDLKLIHHRTSISGIYHTHELTPRDPKPDEPVVINLSTSPSWPVDHVVCYYTLDGMGWQTRSESSRLLSADHPREA